MQESRVLKKGAQERKREGERRERERESESLRGEKNAGIIQNRLKVL